MKRKSILLTAVLVFLLVAAFAVTALAQAMEGPDEVYEGGNVEINFNSPDGGGMEGQVSASSNLSYQGITTSNMGSSLSDENHVFSLFGDPVTYTYSVSASAGDEVSVSLTNAEQSDADGNLTELQDQTWRQTVQATASPSSSPSGNPSSNPSGNPSSNPTRTLDPIPTLTPDPNYTVQPTESGININIVNNNYNTNNNIVYPAVRYPAYAPRPVPQRTVYRSYDGMPKMGDNSSAVNYWALLTIGSLLAVVALVAGSQVYALSEKRRNDVQVTILK